MPDPVDITVDQTPIPTNRPDPSVKIPESVRRAAERANSYYAKPVEGANEPAASAPAQPTEVPPKETPAPDKPTEESALAPKEPTKPAEAAQPEPPAVGTAEYERNRFLSMQGRFQQAQKTIGSMQEQMAELGDELMRTQQVIRAPKAPPPPPLLTPEDETTYGPELIDFAKRAALAAVSPKLQALELENKQLKQQVTRTDRQSVNAQLAAAVPNWREVNVNPRWVQWLRLPDVYSGKIRQQMLNEATTAGDASRVIAFFKGFLAEEQATGHGDPAPPPPPAADVPTAPVRQAAVPLESLAAPGRPRPASGSDVAPTGAADKPVITRAQISEFYANVRKGAYRGQDALKAQHEQIIFAAQREGRVR